MFILSAARFFPRGSSTHILVLSVLALTRAGLGVIPLPSLPSWSSATGDYSTGGGFWDIDGNGFVDFCMSNGNDMAFNRNAVYYNWGGVLENTARWRSADDGMFGHLYLGDVDNDGLMDMAVAYLGPNGDLNARVYRNECASLSTLPWWKSRDSTTHFDCCLGDVNNDGWLDLAITAGDVYSAVREPLKVYFNREGKLDTLPAWQSTNLVATDAIRLADLNRDGKLDLIASANGSLFVYYQRSDGLERLPSWVDTVATNAIGTRLSMGDYDGDGWLDLACVFNGQMNSSANSIRVYHNEQGTLAKPAAYRLQRRNRYSSTIAWGDVNGDGYPDLAAGGWWEPIVVYENRAGVLDTIPGWSWSRGSLLVSENLVWTDIRNLHLRRCEEYLSGDAQQKLFYLRHSPIQDFHGVEINSVPMPRSEYCFDPLTGYVSFRNAPPAGINNIMIGYSYSQYPDLAVTNWQSSDRSYLFLNTTAEGITDASAPRIHYCALQASSSVYLPTIKINAVVPEQTVANIVSYSVDGRRLKRIARDLPAGVHTLNLSETHLTQGLHFIRLICSNGFQSCCRIVKVD